MADEARTPADPTAPAPDERNERDTFLELREVLGRACAALKQTRQHLEALPALEERAQLFVRTLVRQRRELEEAFDRCVLSATREVLDERVQYGVDPSQTEVRAPGSTTPGELARWQTGVDQRLGGALLGLAERVHHFEARELVEAVVGLLAAHDQRVALGLQALHDI